MVWLHWLLWWCGCTGGRGCCWFVALFINPWFLFFISLVPAQVPGRFTFAKHKEGGSLEEIEIYLDEAIKGNTEGLMIKTLNANATYEPSRRSLNWLKLKKDYLEGIGDTLDLVSGSVLVVGVVLGVKRLKRF